MKGICGEHTSEKQDYFKSIIEHHINVVSKITSKSNQFPKTYIYIDAFAGPGQYNHDKRSIIGSPILFDQSIGNIPYKSFLFEKDNWQSLIKYCPEAINEDCQVGIKRLSFHENSFGLAYFDPPGDMDNYHLSFDLMAYLSQKYIFLDLMINIAASSIKRVAYAPHCKNPITLNDKMFNIEKKHWVIRDMVGKHQWTFLVATNYDKWAKWEKKGFYLLDSPKGQDLFNKAKLNKEDYAAWKMDLNGQMLMF